MINIVTFKCLFVLVTFISRFFATKHSFILIMPKLCSNYMLNVPLIPQWLRKLSTDIVVTVYLMFNVTI